MSALVRMVDEAHERLLAALASPRAERLLAQARAGHLTEDERADVTELLRLVVEHRRLLKAGSMHLTMGGMSEGRA